jgi:hypothetical protein
MKDVKNIPHISRGIGLGVSTPAPECRDYAGKRITGLGTEGVRRMETIMTQPSYLNMFRSRIDCFPPIE